MLTKEIGKYIQVLKQLTNFQKSEIATIQESIINNQYDKFLIIFLEKLAQSPNSLLLQKTFYFLVGQKVQFEYLLQLDNKLRYIDIQVLDKIRLFQDFQQILDQNNSYFLSYQYLSMALQLQLEQMDIEKVTKSQSILNVSKSVFDFYQFSKLSMDKTNPLFTDELDLNLLSEIQQNITEFPPINLQNHQEILKLDLQLLSYAWDVYYLKPIQNHILIKNFTPQPLKPAFQAFLHNSTLIVAIRGTTNLKDQYANSQSNSTFQFSKSQKIYFHQGYYKSAYYIISTVLILFNYLFSKNIATNITFTGHSQGGAIASICNFLMQKADFQSNSVGFATPPCASGAISHTRNYVFQADPVPRISDFYLKMVFIQGKVEQFGPEVVGRYIQVKYGVEDDFFVPGEVFMLSEGNLSELSQFGVNSMGVNMRDFGDHRLERYREELQGLIVGMSGEEEEDLDQGCVE